MIVFIYMPFASMRDLLYLVGAICLAWITVFLCWALYQIGKLVHQANEVVEETREKVERVERTLTSMGKYLAFLAEGGKQLVSLLKGKKKKGKMHLSDLMPDE